MSIWRVFAGEAALGNLCQVVGVAPSAPVGLTRCSTRWLGPGEASVTCVAAGGQPIACCGHGLLAACAHWAARGWPGRLSLRMGAGVHPCRREGDRWWVDFPRPVLAPWPVPTWAAALGSEPALRAAVAGGASGYLVLEWPPGFDLTALRPPGAALVRHTGRALLACAVSGEGADLRYFAPQYGVPEDPATGSAMRVLGEYWHWRTGRSALRARQRSPAGGLLFSRIQGRVIAVGGRVVPVPMEGGGEHEWER